MTFSSRIGPYDLASAYGYPAGIKGKYAVPLTPNREAPFIGLMFQYFDQPRFL